MGPFDASDARNHFFFGKFYSELGNEKDVEVYSADHARIPQIKLILEDYLHVDISFAVVSNTEFILGDSIVS